MPIGKEFVLTHVYRNVSSMKETVYYDSPVEEHFGVPWKIGVQRKVDHLGMYLYCDQKQKEEWSIDTYFEMKISIMHAKPRSADRILTSTGNQAAWGWKEFIKWEEMMKDCVIDDTLRVEVHVKIKKMTGIPKKNLMSFDESRKPFSDVVLVVEDQKFYVSKLFLAGQSSFFNSILPNFSEVSEYPEHTLKDVKAANFQNFLELLHGESPIDDSTIEGIVFLSDKYEAKLAIRKCEQFLIENSDKSLKEKLQLAHRYKLKNLKNRCLSKITTAAEIRSVLVHDASEMDPSVIGALLHKSLALHNK